LFVFSFEGINIYLRALVFGTFAFRFPFAFTSHMALPHVFHLLMGKMSAREL